MPAKFESASKNWLLLMLLALAQAQVITEQTSKLSSVLVSCSPATVGAIKAELIVQFYTEKQIAQGSVLKVTVPMNSSVVDGAVQCGVGGFNDQDGLVCQGVDGNALLFELKYDLRPFESNVFSFIGAYNAPLTSEPTETFKLQVFSADMSLVLAQNDQDVSLSLLGPSELTGVTIVQTANASVVVGQRTKLSFSVTTLNPIPPGGGLEILLPKWNPEDTNIFNRLSYVIENEEPLCSVGTGMEQITCSLTTSPIQDTLLVKDMFPNGRLAGDTFVFQVNNALNPLSMSPVDLVVTSYSSTQINGQVFFTGHIDQGTALLQAKMPVPIDPRSATISAENTVVSEETQLIIPFVIPVPVMKELGCTVLITLPNDFPVIAGKMTIFRGWGIFEGGLSNLLADINEQQRTVKIDNQCAKYTPANKQSTLKIGLVQNPDLVKPTGTFKIQLLDNNGQLIASVESGVFYTPTAGSFDRIELLPQSVTVEVQEVTDVELTFTPQHDISSNGKITLRMPKDLPARCDIATVVGFDLPLNCTITDGLIQLMNPFKRNPYFAPQPLSLVFRDLKLPNSARAIRGIQIETFDLLGDQYYLVDSINSPTYEFFTPNSVTFLFSSINTQPTLTTYTETSFRVSATCASQIPAGSVMHLLLPAQITVKNATDVQDNCDAVLNLAEEMECTLVENLDPETLKHDGSHTITIQNAFDVDRSPNDEVVFSIKKGLITPISTETTESFKLSIVDANGYEVNFIKRALTVTMFEGLRIGKIDVKPDVLTVGASSNHEVIFQTPVPFQEGFKVQIFVPPQVIPPRAQDVTCVGKAPLEIDLPCHLNGNRITVEIATQSDVYIDDLLSITVGPMTNPGSTQATDPYQINIRSANFYEVAEELAHPGAAIQMITPSRITDFNFQVFDLRQKALTTVTIDWVSTQTYPRDTKLVIDYDQTQITPQFDDPTSPSVPCIFRKSRLVTCKFEYNRILVEDIMPSEEYGGAQLQLTITNMYINIVDPVTTSSWVLTTFLNDGISKIDRIHDGMTLTFECSYPCLSCFEGQPDQCSSCNTVEGDLILYENQCYDLCPTGTFFEYFQCKLCDSKCLTCEYTSGSSCTSCDVNSENPFLNGKDCSDTCPYGEFGNRDTATCEPCDYPCEQCVDTSTTCTSCRQDSLDKFYFENQCLAECPPGQYTESEARDNVCLPCTENCLTCELSADSCTSCPAGQILNNLDGTCVQSCPQDLSIYTPKNATHPIDTCEPCTSSCKTCKFDTFHCTSCRDPLSLRPWESTCVLECDVFYQSSVSIDNVCVGCSSSCSACQNQPDYCLKCVTGTYFYQNKCLQQCPLIDEYQYSPNEDGVCVIPGLICPFGYKVNYEGNGCELKNQICEVGYELNGDKTACIPAPTSYIPFPILACALLLCLVPIFSRIKSKKTQVIPSLIAFIAPMETVAIAALIIGAKDHGNMLTFYIGLVGFVFLIAGNAFFLLMYVNSVQTDSAFKHWFPKNKKIAVVIQILGFLNFKTFRLLYCRLFGNMCFDAPFTDPTLFYRPYNLTSLFAIITVSLPSIVSSSLGLIYVRWGYQLYISCLEVLVISLALLTLQFAEYCRMKFEQKKYIKVSKREVEVKVRSTFYDDSDEDNGSGPQRRTAYKPKAIRSVRYLEQYIATLEQKDRFAGEIQVKKVDDQIEQLHCEEMMHRQLRRCYSSKNLRPSLDAAFSGSEGESDSFQDFISEPGSPRSKEMLFNRKLIGRIHILHDAYKMRDQYDNCYHEPVDFLPNKLKQSVSRLVQTNVLEMLGIDDIKKGGESDRSNLRSISRLRQNEIPKFEIGEIQGDFESDLNGQLLIVQKQGRFFDKRGRLVNRCGYLVDQIGNVISKTGKIIFFVDELQPDTDELPEPFCQKKIKPVVKPYVVSQKNSSRDQLSYAYKKSSEVQSQVQKKSSEMLHSLENSVSNDASQMINDVQDTSVKDEDDQFIQKLTQPKVPLSKKEIAQAKLQRSESQEPVFRVARAPSQTSIHRVEQLQDMISEREPQIIRKKSSIAPAKILSGPRYEIGVDMNHHKESNSQRHKLLMDQDFLARIEDFNDQLTRKKLQDGQSQLSKDSSTGLAHRNLHNVYGRVKQKMNEKASGSSASNQKRAKNRMQQLTSVYLNPRVDGKEPQKKNRESLQPAIDQLDVTGQLRDLRHIRESAPSRLSPPVFDVRSQDQ